MSFASTAASSSTRSCRTARNRKARCGKTFREGSATSPRTLRTRATSQALKDRLAKNDEEFGTAGNHLFYLSTPPPVFPEIIKHLKKSGLEKSETGWTRIVVEKPFGTDLASARTLQRAIEAVFPENEIYRIDHYLGKEPVQDIIALRFANTIFEPIWNRNYVANVQITSAESFGVEERGGYYDQAGALRDMIQNHVINLLALVAMEAPISAAADDIRSEKYKVLSAIAPPNHADVWSVSARGQYGPGTIDGQSGQRLPSRAGRIARHRIPRRSRR